MNGTQSPTDGHRGTDRSGGQGLSRRRFVAGAGFAGVVGLAGCVTIQASEARATVDRSVAVEDATSLSASTEVGDLTVTGADRTDVGVEAVKRGPPGAIEDMTVEVNRNDGTLSVAASGPNSGSLLGPSPSFDLTVQVPRSLAVGRAQTRVGDVSVSGVSGDLTATSRTGDVTVRSVEGYVTVSADQGDLTVRGTTGVDEVDSDTGDVEADVRSIRGDTTLSTETGDLEVALAADLDADVRATTSTGDVSAPMLSSFSEDVPGETAEGTLGEGTHRLTVRAETGDVTLTSLS